MIPPEIGLRLCIKVVNHFPASSEIDVNPAPEGILELANIGLGWKKRAMLEACFILNKCVVSRCYA
jgi:hypothetical protein